MNCIKPRLLARLMWLSRNVFWKVVDTGIIDGTVNGLPAAPRLSATPCATRSPATRAVTPCGS